MKTTNQNNDTETESSESESERSEEKIDWEAKANHILTMVNKKIKEENIHMSE